MVVIKAPDEMACPHCGRVHPAEDADEEMSWQDALGPASRKVPLAVLGSGFIVDASGLVVTNQHVVGSAQRIVVQLADGRQFPATRARQDATMDLAILKIEAKVPLPVVRLANSEAVEIGDWVLAVGCPLELEQTVSAGIISAKNRSMCANHRARMLQTDAAINPGSSGGPLVNLDGQVVGITTAIASEDGGYQGIGFAIPANHAARLLAEPTNVSPQKEEIHVSQHHP
ncbi:MAG: trypsin-like peptidase domain-containing protein [Thermoguttaceae bacterium]